jgi:nitrite reductase/ring-hydroxylating ferredoxin subunit
MSIEGKLAARVGPILSDGTPLRDLIDLDNHEVSMRVMYDPEIHRLELDRIFTRAWIPVGHESEIPEVGDFITRTIGEDPVIVTRTRDGDIAVLLNVCKHRGMEVCRTDAGNAETFKCPYHGWVYDNSGRLRGAPFEQDMYGKDWDKSRFGLAQARVATRLGVIFASFGPNTPPLDEYLGPMGWYFDQFFGGQPEFTVLGPPLEELTPSNWKLAAEQTMGDGYHQLTLHESARQLGFLPAGDDARSLGLDHIKIGTPEGHCLIGSGISFDYVQGDAELAEYQLPADWMQFIAVLFPATYLMCLAVPVEGGTAHHMSSGSYRPSGTGGLITSNLQVMGNNAPDGFAEQIRSIGSAGFGIVAAGDYDAWPSIQRVSGGAIGQTQTLKYNTFSGPSTPEGWPGPGTVYAGFSRDDNQWNFWLRWLEYLTTE